MGRAKLPRYAISAGLGAGVCMVLLAASSLPQRDTELGVNIALAALGGQVVSPTELSDPERTPASLTDGFPVIWGYGSLKTSRGWRSETREFPQSIVFAFRENRTATIAAVVIDTAAADNLGGPGAIPSQVEIHVSTLSAVSGFTKVAAATLGTKAGEELIRFGAVQARFVRVVIAGTHGGDEPQIGEVQIFEAPGAASIVADLPKNLLLPALGGSFVWFTSQDREGGAVNLVDGRVADDAGWASGPSTLGPPSRLPQSFVFAFRDHRAAAIDRVVVTPTSQMGYYIGPKPFTDTWVKSVEIATSDDPWDGFDALPAVAVPAVARPVTIPVGRTARYLRLRVLDNHGFDVTTLGEVAAFERASAGPTSILRGRSPQVGLEAAVGAGGAETVARREREPNNTTDAANAIGAPGAMGGRITPANDRDVFSVSGATGAVSQQVLTVDIEGRPAIRTRIGVLDATGSAVFDWDPAKAHGPRARFSVATPRGDLFLRVSQPPAAQVVIWDTSGSMNGRTADLEAALRGYIAQLNPTDRVQLVRFDDTVEVLMKDFSVDKKALAGALADKVYADGGTAIYDAVLKGLSLVEPVGGNRALVLLTDGADLSSTAEPSDFWLKLRADHTRLFAIGLGNGLRDFVGRAGATGARVLANAAQATDGTFLFVEKASDLPAFYQRIAADLRSGATYAVSATTSTSVGAILVKAVGEQLTALVAPRVVFVLDASGSMRRLSDGKPMMTAAKEVLIDAIRRLPADAEVALRVYGHRIPDGKPGTCDDTELIVPFGRLDRQRLINKVNGIAPVGSTPLARSIEAAGADLAGPSGPTMIIVVTDGQESCGGNPVEAASKLRAAGLHVTLNMVGFGLSTKADRDAMTKIAQAGGGQYFDAGGQSALRSALDQAMAVPFDVVDAAGLVVARGVVGGPPVSVPAGVYAVRFSTSGDPIVADQVTVAIAQTTSVELRKEGTEISVRVAAPGRAGGGHQ